MKANNDATLLTVVAVDALTGCDTTRGEVFIHSPGTPTHYDSPPLPINVYRFHRSNDFAVARDPVELDRKRYLHCSATTSKAKTPRVRNRAYPDIIMARKIDVIR